MVRETRRRCGRRRETSKDHPTAKPVALWVPPIENHTKPRAEYEPFSGSGSQIIAAEQTGRRCYAMELSPQYVDVAVRRWQQFTGQQARLGESDMTFADIEAAREGNEHGTTAVSTD
jgi:DNA modification methylase